MSIKHWWNDTDRGKPKRLETNRSAWKQTCPSATSSLTNLTCTDLGSSPGLRRERLGLTKLKLLIQVSNNCTATHGPGKLADRNMLTDRMHQVQYNKTQITKHTSKCQLLHVSAPCSLVTEGVSQTRTAGASSTMQFSNRGPSVQYVLQVPAAPCSLVTEGRQSNTYCRCQQHHAV